MVNQAQDHDARAVDGKIHYGWLIVGMATVLQVTTSFISQAFAILIVILQDEFQWTLTAIILAYFFRSIVSSMLAPVAGWIADRYGTRRSLLVASTLYVSGMFLLSTITTVWQLYLYYSLVLGTAQALFQINIPTTVAAWFRRRLGLAVGLQQSGGSMGGSVMAPALALLLSRTDWQTAFWIIPIVGGIIVFSLVMLFHGDPADVNKKPYGTREDDPPAPINDPAVTKVRSQVFLKHARNTRAFWNLIAIHHLGCIGHSIVMVGAVFFATNQHGISLQAAAWIVSIYSLASVGSRFATPILADIWGAKGIMVLAYTIQGISVALLFWAHDPWQFYIFAVIFGFGLGGEMSAFLVINRQYFGMGPVRTVFGFQSLGSGMGMALGGLLGGVVYDFFGSYDIAWVISIAASLGGAACILLLEPTSRLLIPNWEESLPAEARTPATAQAT